MTLVTCGNCGQRVAVTALAEHADECRRIAVAKTLKGAAQPAPQSPPPLSEENVERVARALWARLYDDPPLKWPGLTHPDAECIVEDARAAITALTTQESNRE